MTLRGITLPISYNVYGPFGEHLGRPKIAHGSHNDIRRLCWHAGAMFAWRRRLHLPASAVVKGIGGNRGSVQHTLGRERAYMEEKGLPSSLPQGEGGCKSRPHFKIAFYVYVYPVISRDI